MTRPQTWLVLARIAFLIALGLGLWLALKPAGEVPGLIPWDKAQHFIAFYVLAGLGAAATPRLPLWAPALFLALYGAAIEGLQALPAVGRDAEWGDWAADLLAVGACYLPLVLRPWRRWTR